MSSPYDSKYNGLRSQIEAVAIQYGIDPKIAVAQLWQESRFLDTAVSGKNAQRIAQFIPGTAKDYGIANLQTASLAQVLDAYGRYMRDLLKMFNQNYSKALAGYNAGPGAVRKYNGIPPFAETQKYVAIILANAGKAGAGGTVIDAGQLAEVTVYEKDSPDDSTATTLSAAAIIGLGILAILIIRS